MFRTLLVEDSRTFRDTLSGVLHTHFPDMQVVEAEDGVQALDEVESVLPDIIFMDIKLPGASGIELTRQIKLAHAEVVVVILTSYDLPEYRQAAYRNGADCFISKGDVCCMVEVLARVEGVRTLRKIH